MTQEKKPLITHIFTADPSAHVFNDKIYIYPSHDIPQKQLARDVISQSGEAWLTEMSNQEILDLVRLEV